MPSPGFLVIEPERKGAEMDLQKLNGEEGGVQRAALDRSKLSKKVERSEESERKSEAPEKVERVERKDQEVVQGHQSIGSLVRYKSEGRAVVTQLIDPETGDVKEVPPEEVREARERIREASEKDGFDRTV